MAGIRTIMAISALSITRGTNSVLQKKSTVAREVVCGWSLIASPYMSRAYLWREGHTQGD